MISLIDTTIIIDYLRGHPKSRDFIKEEFLYHRIPYTSVVSYVEIFAGVRFEEEDHIAKLFDNLKIVQIGIEIGRQAGKYLNIYSKSHGLEIADALIAATAFIVGARLVTLDKKHFPMTDIKVFMPY